MFERETIIIGISDRKECHYLQILTTLTCKVNWRTDHPVCPQYVVVNKYLPKHSTLRQSCATSSKVTTNSESQTPLIAASHEA